MDTPPPLPPSQIKYVLQIVIIAIFIIFVFRSLLFNNSSNIPNHNNEAPQSIESVNNSNNNLNERVLLVDSFFGDFRKCDKINESGKIDLQVWGPQIKWVKSLPPVGRDVLLEGVQFFLQIEYDEIWKVYDVFDYPGNQYAGKYDKYKLYWKNGKVQASTLEKFFKDNPSTHQPLNRPSYKIVSIYNRRYILDKLNE